MTTPTPTAGISVLLTQRQDHRVALDALQLVEDTAAALAAVAGVRRLSGAHVQTASEALIVAVGAIRPVLEVYGSGLADVLAGMLRDDSRALDAFAAFTDMATEAQA